MQAMNLAREISKLPGGNFAIAFYQYDRINNRVSDKLRVEEGCRLRPQLPKDAWDVGSENYFLFEDKNGKPKTAWRILVRFIGFPPDYKLRKIKWIW